MVIECNVMIFSFLSPSTSNDRYLKSKNTYCEPLVSGKKKIKFSYGWISPDYLFQHIGIVFVKLLEKNTPKEWSNGWFSKIFNEFQYIRIWKFDFCHDKYFWFYEFLMFQLSVAFEERKKEEIKIFRFILRLVEFLLL